MHIGRHSGATHSFSLKETLPLCATAQRRKPLCRTYSQNCNLHHIIPEPPYLTLLLSSIAMRVTNSLLSYCYLNSIKIISQIWVMIREITATDMYTTGLKHLTCIFFFKKAAKNIQPELRSSILFLVSLIMRKTSWSFRISLFRHTLTVTELSPPVRFVSI